MMEPTRPTRVPFLTRRSLVALACFAPFANRAANAAERISVAELWAEGAEFSQRARELAGKPVEITRVWITEAEGRPLARQ